jgi:Histidine kinase-, DNA gyrase B-, and HSP90-like ATPase
MTEGPYRDLGSGFARLAGAEGLRRSPWKIRSVEDALFELLRNSRDAKARNIYVASTLRARRYRTLAVIDDGRGIPETHKHLIFEPGVTTRHLGPSQDDNSLHGAGLSLYHIKNAALDAEVLSASAPTAIRAVFDTRTLPEKSLQSNARPSKTNLPATLSRFVGRHEKSPHLYYSSPARILARLLDHHIIQWGEGEGSTGLLRETAWGLGLEVSLRTVQRVVAGEVLAANEVEAGAAGGDGRVVRGRATRRNGAEGPILSVGPEDLAEISTVLRRAARLSYLNLAGLDVEKRPGELVLRAHVYEPEEEYE